MADIHAKYARVKVHTNSIICTCQHHGKKTTQNQLLNTIPSVCFEREFLKENVNIKIIGYSDKLFCFFAVFQFL